jgi:hypothetical protein
MQGFMQSPQNGTEPRLLLFLPPLCRPEDTAGSGNMCLLLPARRVHSAQGSEPRDVRLRMRRGREERVPRPWARQGVRRGEVRVHMQPRRPVHQPGRGRGPLQRRLPLLRRIRGGCCWVPRRRVHTGEVQLLLGPAVPRRCDLFRRHAELRVRRLLRTSGMGRPQPQGRTRRPKRKFDDRKQQLHRLQDRRRQDKYKVGCQPIHDVLPQGFRNAQEHYF